MSNFSNLGFNATTQEEFMQILDSAYRASSSIKVKEGVYSIYTDPSGAELFIQFDTMKDCLGSNPHYKGKSKRTVCLTNSVDRPESELDGAFHCWADPAEENNPDSGAYPFIFDIPDFRTIGHIDFPRNFDIQLVAFAQELSIFESEKEYQESQSSEPKWATQSFVPTGLFSFGEEGQDAEPPQATGMFTGIIKEFERKRNTLTNNEFYWLLVDTLGGEVDVVADIAFFDKDPAVHGVIQGHFWLSGRLINPPLRELKVQKGFFQKLFGR